MESNCTAQLTWDQWSLSCSPNKQMEDSHTDSSPYWGSSVWHTNGCVGMTGPYKIPYVAITSANTCGHSKGKAKGYSLCRVKLNHFPGLSALFQCSIVPAISQTWNSIVWHHHQLNCMCIHNMFNCTSCITLQTNEMLVWQRTEPLMLATHVHTHRQTQAPTHRHTHTHNVNTSVHMHAVE